MSNQINVVYITVQRWNSPKSSSSLVCTISSLLVLLTSKDWIWNAISLISSYLMYIFLLGPFPLKYLFKRNSSILSQYSYISGTVFKKQSIVQTSHALNSCLKQETMYSIQSYPSRISSLMVLQNYWQYGEVFRQYLPMMLRLVVKPGNSKPQTLRSRYKSERQTLGFFSTFLFFRLKALLYTSSIDDNLARYDLIAIARSNTHEFSFWSKSAISGISIFSIISNTSISYSFSLIVFNTIVNNFTRAQELVALGILFTTSENISRKFQEAGNKVVQQLSGRDALLVI